MTRPIDKTIMSAPVLPMSASVMNHRIGLDSLARCDAVRWMIPDGERSHKECSLTCNRWRRTGNIANKTTANSMRENTEISSGNRDASTTDADVAALIESTDVRLYNGENDASGPGNNILTFLGCK